MVNQRILLLLGCVALCWAEQVATWNWTCEAVKAQEGVDIDKVVGLWYFVEGIVTGAQKNERNCNMLRILTTSDNSNLLFQYLILDQMRTENISVTVTSPSKWIEDGHAEVVVDLPADGSTLAITRCNHVVYEHRTMVYSKNMTVELEPVHARLKDSGVRGVKEAKPYNRTGCPTLNESETIDGEEEKKGSAYYPQPSNIACFIFLLGIAIVL